MDIELVAAMFEHQGWSHRFDFEAQEALRVLGLLVEASSDDSEWDSKDESTSLYWIKTVQAFENVYVRLTKYEFYPGVGFGPLDTELILASILAVKLNRMTPNRSKSFIVHCDSAYSGFVRVHNIGPADAVIVTQVICGLDLDLPCKYTDTNSRWGGTLSTKRREYPASKMDLNL